MKTLKGRKAIYSTELKQLVWSNTNEPIHASWELGENVFQSMLDNVPALKKHWRVNHLKYASVLNSFLNDRGKFDYVWDDNSNIPKHPALTKAVNAIEYAYLVDGDKSIKNFLIGMLYKTSILAYIFIFGVGFYIVAGLFSNIL